jgi:hypothetical protein
MSSPGPGPGSSPGYQQPAAATIVPTSLSIHAVDSGQFRLVAHLRSGLNTFRQHNSQPMTMREVVQWLHLWEENPADCLARLFGWRPADIDAAIKATPKAASRPAGRRSPATSLPGLTLADLGL